MAVSTGGGSSAAAGIRAGRAYVELGILDKATSGIGAVVRKLGSGVRAAVPALGAGLLGGSVAGLFGASKVLESLQDTARLSQTAKAMGLTAEQFSGIAGVAASAGEPLREFIESMVTLGKVVDEGVAAKGEVAAKFFDDIGVSAREFKALRPDEQFYKVFEALEKVQDPAKRVRALMVAFGEDGGKYLLPLLSKAPGELREMARGFVLTAEEAAAAEKANAAYVVASASLSQTWRKLSVAAAPAAEALAGVAETAGKAALLVGKSDWLTGTQSRLTMFGETVSATWKGIQDAISGGDLELAARVGFGGIETAWDLMVGNLAKRWQRFTSDFRAGLLLVKGMVEGGAEDKATDFLQGLNLLKYRAGLISFDEGQERFNSLNAGRDLLMKERNDEINKQIGLIRQENEQIQRTLDQDIAASQNKKRAELYALNIQALNASNMEDFFGRMMSGFQSGNKPKLPTPGELIRLGNSITTFGGFGDVRQEIGGGGGGIKELVRVAKEEKVIAQRSEGHLKNINDGIHELRALRPAIT